MTKVGWRAVIVVLLIAAGGFLILNNAEATTDPLAIRLSEPNIDPARVIVVFWWSEICSSGFTVKVAESATEIRVGKVHRYKGDGLFGCADSGRDEMTGGVVVVLNKPPGDRPFVRVSDGYVLPIMLPRQRFIP